MITLLSKLFIKNHTNYKDKDVRYAYGVLCSITGICLNVLLFAGKYIAGLLAKSISITADAFNNLSDAGSSIITLLGFKLGAQKPDKDHPFGHGRYEYISGLLVSIAIVLMGFELLTSAIDKIKNPAPVEFSPLIIGILIASILVKVYMSIYNNKVGEKIDSAAMKATSTDSLSDCIATGVVLLSTIIGKITGWMIDGWSGLLVSAFVLFAGIRSAIETINVLLGQPPTKEMVDEIESIVMSHEGIKGIHDLIINDYGPGRCIISLHAEVPADRDIMETHDEIDLIESELNEKLNCVATIHMDPIVTTDKNTLKLKELVKQIVKQTNQEFSFHDFRCVVGPTHTNLIFDVVVPFEEKRSNEEIRSTIEKEIQKTYKNHYCVINFDRPFTCK